jgi:hypothetical protein
VNVEVGGKAREKRALPLAEEVKGILIAKGRLTLLACSAHCRQDLVKHEKQP